jgi:uncharacterized protein
MLTSPQPASLGRVISVRGSQARVGLVTTSQINDSNVRATVGQFFGIRTATTIIVAMITEVSRENLSPTDNYIAIASVDLLGEIAAGPSGRFQRGVTSYPTIGDLVDVLTNQQLRTVYAPSKAEQINIGTLQQDPSVIAYVDVEDMLSKHFAVLGSTGVGKSSGVSLLLNEILRVRPNLRVFLLDVHNEYGRCFGDKSLVLNPRNLKLPFWLFNFEEFVDVIFGGRPGVPEELEVLVELIPVAKATYTQYQNTDRVGLKRVDAKTVGYTADTPVPYRLVDLISLIDERMGKLENRSSRIVYHKLISRIETVKNDPRYAFMFENANVGGDTMAEVISYLFRMPANGRPMTVMQLAGFPAEVVDSVVSVLCRMAFDFGLWSDGASPLLFVCEEAHRYASADRGVGFGPSRSARQNWMRRSFPNATRCSRCGLRTSVTRCCYAPRFRMPRRTCYRLSRRWEPAKCWRSAKALRYRPGSASRKFRCINCHVARRPSRRLLRLSAVTTLPSSVQCWSAGVAQHHIAKRRTIQHSTAAASIGLFRERRKHRCCNRR